MNHYLFYAISSQLMLVAWFDLKKKTISNYWPLFNTLVAIIAYLAFPQTYEFNWEILFFPLGFIVIGFLLFLMGIMGAGDSKYLASLFLVIPVQYHLPFFEKLLIATILIGGFLLSFKVVMNFSKLKAYMWAQYWNGLKETIRSKFSYAPVILLAWILLGVQEWR
jgi:prepilin peptidase CpaA